MKLEEVNKQTKEAVDFLVAALESVGLGPSWLKLEGSIRYAEEDVLRYIERNRRTPSVRAYMEERNAI